MSDKPLNVRVAEALGWTDFRQMATHNVGMPNLTGGFSSPRAEKVWCGVAPIDHDPKECVNLYDGEACDHVASHPDYEPWHQPVPPYGEDSPEGRAVTLSLAVDYGFWLLWFQHGAWHVCIGHDQEGFHEREDCDYAEASKVTEAIAELILKLKDTRWAEAGRLPK